MSTIRPLGEHCGVEISDIDGNTADAAAFAPVYQAWLDYGVMVVRGQNFTETQFIEYSRRFGDVVLHPSKSTRNPDYPLITMLGINKFNADGTLNRSIYKRGSGGWHTDGAYDDVPFKATQLYALAVPDTGGDTHFSSMYAAYAALPDGLKQKLEGVNGAFTYDGRKPPSPLLNKEDQNLPPAFHPLIRTHSETGRKSLYFDPGKIQYIDGWEKAASDDMIDELTERMIAPGAQYTHQWRVGDTVIWDNRCMVHKAAGDYPPEQDRIHWRTSIKEPGAAADVAA